MRSKKNVKSACSGMTLIEVIMVMAILSIVMLAVMSLYIPAQRSTVVQTQVSDVQENLQLAMSRLSQDLLTAGFLVNGQAISAETATGFTISTRLVGNGFGRIESVVGNVLTLSLADMIDEFPDNSFVRIMDPVTASEITVSGTDYTVTDSDRVLKAVTLNTMPADVAPESVLIRIPNAATPSIQTIQYQFADSDGDSVADALVRIVNGNTQFLARNVSAVNFVYDYTTAATPKVKSVDITLTGQTRELVAGDAIASAKTRSLRTSVSLRNVF
jgi:prepilin-type N-terminal cleavage/methylation domain-containing protein